MATASPPQKPPLKSPQAQTRQPTPTIAVSSYFAWKGFADRLLAAILLVPGIPLMAVLWIVVRLASPGPVFFSQVRVGRNGKNFVMYKFRSMVLNAEAKSGAVWASPNDPRLTRVGALLRKLHLDEMPQLWNVLRGDMSLVGPRPERPEFVIVLGEQIPSYRCRLSVAPGITGLAQVNLPPDTDMDSVRRKLVLDLEYIRTGSLLLDLRLVFYSGMRMFGLPGPILIRCLRLGRVVDESQIAAERSNKLAETSDDAGDDHAHSGAETRRRAAAKC